MDFNRLAARLRKNKANDNVSNVIKFTKGPQNAEEYPTAEADALQEMIDRAAGLTPRYRVFIGTFANRPLKIHPDHGAVAHDDYMKNARALSESLSFAQVRLKEFTHAPSDLRRRRLERATQKLQRSVDIALTHMGEKR